MSDQFSPLPVKGLKTNNSAAPASPGDFVGVLPAIVDASDPTYTAGRQAALSVTTGGALRVVLSGTTATNLTQIGGNVVSVGSGVNGTGVQRVTIATDQSVLTFKIDQTTPGTTDRVTVNQDKINGVALLAGNGATGTGSPRVTIASDNTPFAVKVSKDASTNAATNPIFTQLTDGTSALGNGSNPLVVTLEGAGAGTLVDSGKLTSAAVAAGASATVSTADITTAKTGKLLEMSASASVRLRVVLETFDGTTATEKRVFFVEANQTLLYEPRDRDTITQAGGTGKKFRLTIKNMDDTNAADVYGHLTHEEV